MPKVSVIIPCYNQGAFIGEAIESVQKQTFTDWEIIVVNDGSDEEATLVQFKKIQSEKITVLHTSNYGLSTARNNGIAVAKGKYILPLDADDKIGEHYIEKAVDCLERDVELKIVYCEAVFFGNQSGKWLLPEFSLSEMLKQNLIFCSAFFRRSDFETVNGYKANMKFGWEDWDLWLSILEIGGKVYKIPELLFYYRKHSSSMVGDIADQTSKRLYLENQIVANHLVMYQKFFPDPLTLLRELDSLRAEKENFEKVKEQIYHSLSYRIGHIMLSPFKWLLRTKN